MQTKRVNIYPNGPIINVNPPIRTITKDVLKPVNDIKKCILAGAYVEEVFGPYKTVKLNLSNYDRDNTPPKPTNINIESATAPIENSVDVEPPQEVDDKVTETEAVFIDPVEEDKPVEETIEVEEETIVEDTVISAESNEEMEDTNVDVTAEEVLNNEVNRYSNYKSMSKKERKKAKQAKND